MVSPQNPPLKLVSVFLAGNEMVIQPVKIFSAVWEKKMYCKLADAIAFKEVM